MCLDSGAPPLCSHCPPWPQTHQAASSSARRASPCSTPPPSSSGPTACSSCSSTGHSPSSLAACRATHWQSCPEEEEERGGRASPPLPDTRWRRKAAAPTTTSQTVYRCCDVAEFQAALLKGFQQYDECLSAFWGACLFQLPECNIAFCLLGLPSDAGGALLRCNVWSRGVKHRANGPDRSARLKMTAATTAPPSTGPSPLILLEIKVDRMWPST